MSYIQDANKIVEAADDRDNAPLSPTATALFVAMTEMACLLEANGFSKEVSEIHERMNLAFSCFGY